MLNVYMNGKRYKSKNPTINEFISSCDDWSQYWLEKNKFWAETAYLSIRHCGNGNYTCSLKYTSNQGVSTVKSWFYDR